MERREAERGDNKDHRELLSLWFDLHSIVLIYPSE